LRARGEAYRVGLQAIVASNGTADHVIFANRFVELSELTRFIGAADIYITPYLGAGQASSGTLSYAFGTGKPVISTPYWHATELLRDGRGVMVPFADPAATAREVRALLRDPARREAMSGNAYRLGREMVWGNVARLYMASFAAARLQTQPAHNEGAPQLDPGYLYHMLIRPFYSSARESLRRNYHRAASAISRSGGAAAAR
jgi:glycosyltransferase involved in cell wall biosynthesis